MLAALGVKIFGKDLFSSKLSGASKKMQKFSQRAGKLGRNMSIGFTAPAALFGGTMLNVAGDFEYGMNRVQAITDATGDSLGRLRKRAATLGRDTSFTPGQVTQGMGLLAQAGLQVDTIYSSVGSVLKGAEANMVDMGEAALIGSGLMKTFGYNGKQMNTVMDILTKTSMSSMTNFSELAEAFLYAGPSAGAMGKKLKDTSVALAALANGMMKGSMAGTSLRGMMAKLTAPSAEAVSIMQSLGISYDDILDKKGDLRGFIDVVKAFEGTGVTAGEILQIFGLRAGPGFQILLNTGSKALTELDKKISKFGGTTDKIAKVQLSGFNGQILKLKSAFQGFQIAIADSGILTFVTKVLEKVTGFFQRMAKANPKLLKFLFILVMLVAAIGPVALAIAGLAAAFVSLKLFLIVAAIVAVIGALAALVIWFKDVVDWTAKWGWSLGLMFGPIGWIIWGLALIIKHFEKLKEIWNWWKDLDWFQGIGKFLADTIGPNNTPIVRRNSDILAQPSIADLVYNQQKNSAQSDRSVVEMDFKNVPPGVQPVIKQGNIKMNIEKRGVMDG